MNSGVVCIGGNPETAIIIGSLWSDDIPAPGSTLKEIIMTAPDGAVFRYDADAGALEVKGIKTASIQADTRITLDTSEVVCTRKLITATLEVQNGGEMRGSISHSGGSLTFQRYHRSYAHPRWRQDGPGHHGRPAMTAVYRGMNPQGTGTLSDSEHLKNSVRIS
ncbi:baseplate assembly protein V [Escherichia coli]|uniref:Baseplate assembly protein V n=1 Tax=Escherichia coli TaxID=562 RepID=A0A376MVV2_ECOLX|nr:baseplate assembly protein V [Escherichia coli]